MHAPIVAWRRPVKEGRSTPLVVFLHGRGADERDLLELAPALPRHYAFASIRAPLALPEGGYRWFEDRGVGRPIAASLNAARSLVRTVLDGKASRFQQTFLFGFSQGTMLAGALLLDDPKRYAGAVLLSGAIALDAEAQASMDRLAGLPIFTGHGSADRAIPPDLVTATLRYLRDKSGAELTERTYARDHAIAREELADIAAWFAERA